MWALRPSYYDNDMPIDLRKKVVLQRNLEEQKESCRSENTYAPKDYSINEYRERYQQPPALLPVGNLYPFMSERYGVRCSLVNSEENKVQDLRPGSRGSLETTIRKLHFNSRLKKQTTENIREERCRSTDTLLENNEKSEKTKHKGPARSQSCPDLTNFKLKSPPKQHATNYSMNEAYSFEQKTSPPCNNFSTHDDLRTNSPIIGGAKKRKSFIPLYGDRAPSPKKQPKSPAEQPPYEEYFSHPEILLRRQLQQHSTSPYLFHVYDYYQHLVQRLRDHSAATFRVHPPISPTPTEDDIPTDAQRKRPCRALTGKHVRQGTGASLSTLLTLRQKIQERQKAREHQPRSILNGTNCKSTSCSKKCNPKKSKHNAKNPISKIQNC